MTQQELIDNLVALRQLVIDGHMDWSTDGLCLLISDLKLLDKHEDMYKYIKHHKPERGIHYNPPVHNTAYYWNPGATKPRIAWLTYRIKLERAKLKRMNSKTLNTFEPDESN